MVLQVWLQPETISYRRPAFPAASLSLAKDRALVEGAVSLIRGEMGRGVASNKADWGA